MLPKLSGNGYLICGDAAGFCLNIGYMVRGMDLAISSGELAAQTVISATKNNNYSETELKKYEQLVTESYIMKDLKTYQKFPTFMENPRIFNEYPKMITDIMEDMFVINGDPAVPMRKKLIKHLKSVGYMNLAKDVFKGATSL
jgi:electron transfer flavoprotein-quinone oxidoreductase